MATPLRSDEVERIIKDSLYLDEELPTDQDMSTPPEGSVFVEGIIHSYAFHPDRLRSHEAEIREMIDQLPIEFLEEHLGGGGGWTFLNICMTRSGEQWTGLHLMQEQFYALAAGLDLARIQLPRAVWSALPGSVPYIVFGERPNGQTAEPQAS